MIKVSDIVSKLDSEYESSIITYYWEDARGFFPGPWDCIEFKWNVKTGKLYADTSTYPNQFGACHESRFFMTAEEFHKIAMCHSFPDSVTDMKTQTDWDAVRLTPEVTEHIQQIEQKNKEKDHLFREQRSVKIPEKYLNKEPNQDIRFVSIVLGQAHSGSEVTVQKTEDNLFLCKYWSTNIYSNSVRKLNKAESGYLEDQILAAVKKEDELWNPNFDSGIMTVEIQKGAKALVSCRNKQPLKKYIDLMNTICALNEYGSTFVPE